MARCRLPSRPAFAAGGFSFALVLMLASSCRTQLLDDTNMVVDRDMMADVAVDLAFGRDFAAAPVDLATAPSNAPVDILIVVSTSQVVAQPLQARLRATGTALFAELAHVADWHVGIVSADLGVGSAKVAGCTATGYGAKLHPNTGDCNEFVPPYMAGSGSVSSNTNGDPGSFFVQCYAGDIPDGGGCIYQQPWNAAIQALSPAINPGFLRAGSKLAVIFVSDTEDCSTSTGSTLFAPNPLPDGPVRCLVEGTSCNAATPGTYSNCSIPQSAPTSNLSDVATISAGFKAATSTSSSLVVARITSGTTSVTIDHNGAETPACQESPYGVGALPSVRIDTFPSQPFWTSDIKGNACSNFDNLMGSIIREVVRE